ncbi:hypothetical protein EHS25_006489 [Saitozyma podzolica]|uniref:WSC domain-containing protein n=1 Tax=Saitozyma podzolica TaxID=1890683 RepID=A0A427YRX7_9TREE|nr:hypothetical protein EHS25_006489 [Saitozyma podzolica]
MPFLLTRLFPLALLLTLAAGATAPTGWIYEGCLYDNSGNRALNKTFYALNTMTNEVCRAYCGSYGFTYAGMEVGFQCFCGSSFLYYTVQSESNCNTSCYGASTELCGGSGYMTLFQLTFDDSATVATAGTSSTTSAAAAVAASSSSSDTSAIASATSITAATTSGVSSSADTQPTSSVMSGTASSGSVASSITQSGSGTTAVNSTSVSFGALSGASGTAPSSTSGATGKVVMPTTNVSAIITAGQVAATPNFRDGAQAVVFGKIASGSKRFEDLESLLAVTVPVAIAMLWSVTFQL